MSKAKIKAVIPYFSKYRVIQKDNKYIVEVPSFYFFWKPLKIKLISNSVLDFEVDAEFKTKLELNDFIKYKIFDTKRIQGLM